MCAAPRQSRIRKYWQQWTPNHRSTVPGEESQLYCKPVAKKPKTTGAASSTTTRPPTPARRRPRTAPAPEPIDVDADDASDGDDLDRFGPRTEVDLRLGDAYASGVVVLAPEHEAWWNADTKKRLADLERAVATHPALAVAPKEGAKLPRATVLGDDLEATVSFAAAPAPYLLLVADADAGAGGYRQLSHDGYRLLLVACGRGAPLDGPEMSGKPTPIDKSILIDKRAPCARRAAG